MTGAILDYSALLEDALERHGSPLTSDELLEILREASESTSEALSAGERDFLLEATDLTPADLTPGARARSRARVAQGRARAEAQLRAGSLTTGEVAELLGRQAASIRRSKGTGELYALPTSTGRSTLFPSWQFVEGAVVPGLREIIPAFPRDAHPLSIERFMTSPQEDLEGRSPVQWLRSGGSVGAVVSLAEELGRE